MSFLQAKIIGEYIKIGHDHFTPHPSQAISHNPLLFVVAQAQYKMNFFNCNQPSAGSECR
jgi:hypothetical protein